MNHDERLMKQVDSLLEHGKPSDFPVINMLADTLAQPESLPQADVTFRDELEEQLVARLQQRHKRKQP